MRNKKSYCKVEFNFPNDLLKGVPELEKICNAADAGEQISFLKQIKSFVLQKDIKDKYIAFTKALCIMLYDAPSNSSVKKALNRIICEISEKYPSDVKCCIEQNIQSVLNLSTSAGNTEKTILYILSLMEDLHQGKEAVNECYIQVWNFISYIFQDVINNIKENQCFILKSEYFDTSLNLLKLITNFLQCSKNLQTHLQQKFNDSACHSSLNVTSCITFLLLAEETTLNCRLNAAFAYCNVYYYTFGTAQLKVNLLNESSEQFPFISELCIHSAIMAILPINELMERTTNIMLAKKIIIYKLCLFTKIKASDVLLIIGKNILQWTNLIWNILNKVSDTNKDLFLSIKLIFDENGLIQKLFDYVLQNREHYIDNLRYLSKDIFRNIINIHLSLSGLAPRESPVLKDMTIYLLKDLPAHKHGKYGLLSCLVEKLGTQLILEWHPSLPDELYETIKDYSLVPHISEVCSALFNYSVDLEASEEHTVVSFKDIWIKPLLNIMCTGSKEQIRGVNEYILPKLLERKPACLSFLLSELSNMWAMGVGNSFISFVICMKLHQKNTGSSNFLEFMSYESCTRAFFHAEDQVRLAAFSLVCESFKSTEPVNKKSFELIKSGLCYNLDCQSPSFRQQLISFMKKLFTRMVESTAAALKLQANDLESLSIHNCRSKLYKRWKDDSQCKGKTETCSKEKPVKHFLPKDYEEFLHWHRDYLYVQLHPGANFPRRVMALNLLYTMHKIFSETIPIVYSATAASTLLNSFKDTYENNKSLSLKLLTEKDTFKFCIKDGKLIEAAVDLASSSKPPDTVTAAYLFSYMVQCDSMPSVLQRYFPDSTIPCSRPLYPVTYIKNSYDVLYNTILFLLKKLQLQLQVAKNNLLEAAVQAPLYGILACIRNVLKNDINIKSEHDILMWQELISNVIDVSKEVVSVVEGVLSSSSPEGYIPEYTEDGRNCLELVGKFTQFHIDSNPEEQDLKIEEENSASSNKLGVKLHARIAQVVLLCCWRAHKEVSLLFGDISEKLSVKNDSKAEEGLLKPAQMSELGNFFIQQMTLVKHKGAFEQAYVGFSKLCHRLWRCHIPKLSNLPEKWLFDLIKKIDCTSSEIELCATRRSAGLPFIMQGLLTSEPSVASSRIFKKTMSILLNLSKKDNNAEVQIHALNILRALFRDATLSEAVMPFVSSGFIKAIEGFKSQDWGIRNSSTLLFSALMTRMFGVNRSHDETGKKNKMSGKNFVSFYKELYNYLYEEMKTIADSFQNLKTGQETKISIQPSLYPILMILGRLHPANGLKDEQLSVFIPYLQTFTCSSIWKTRDMAVKALVSVIPQDKMHSFLIRTINDLPTMKDYCMEKRAIFLQNSIHGKLLQILYLLKEYKLSDQMSDLTECLRTCFHSDIELFLKLNKCLSTRTVFLEIYLLSLSLDIDFDTLSLSTFLRGELKSNFDSASHPELDGYLVTVTAALFFLRLQMFEKELMNESPSAHSLSILSVIKLFFCESNNAVVRTVLEILFWLFKSADGIDKYYLETSDDFIEFQRIANILSFLKKEKFSSFKLNDPDLACEIQKFWNAPYAIKQMYNLSVVMPSLAEKLMESDDIYEAQKKLAYFVERIEASTSDEETCALILFSTHIFVGYCRLLEVSLAESTSSYLNIFSGPYEKWLTNIEEAANPDNSIVLRQAVLSVLSLLYSNSVFPDSKFLDSKICCLWNSLLLLLIDDEPEIKQKASELVVNMTLPNQRQGDVSPVVPSKAVELMLTLFIDTFQTEPSIKINQESLRFLTEENFSISSSQEDSLNVSFLNQRNFVSIMINWMLSSKAVSLDCMNDEQPFDKGEMNVFSEDLALTSIVKTFLVSLLQCHEEHYIFSLMISSWKDKHNSVMTFDNAIRTCLEESVSIVNSIIVDTNLPVITDVHLDQGLIQISQRLSVANALLPSHLRNELDKLACMKRIGDLIRPIYEKINLLPLKTFFVEDVLNQLESFLELEQDVNNF